MLLLLVLLSVVAVNFLLLFSLSVQYWDRKYNTLNIVLLPSNKIADIKYVNLKYSYWKVNENGVDWKTSESSFLTRFNFFQALLVLENFHAETNF